MYFWDLFVSLREGEGEDIKKREKKTNKQTCKPTGKETKGKKRESFMIAILVIKLIMGIGCDRVYFGVRENVCFPVQRNPPKGVRVLR